MCSCSNNPLKYYISLKTKLHKYHQFLFGYIRATETWFCVSYSSRMCNAYLTSPHGDLDKFASHVHQLDVPLGYLTAALSRNASYILHTLTHTNHI